MKRRKEFRKGEKGTVVAEPDENMMTRGTFLRN